MSQGRFTTVSRLRSGYDRDEVDAFFDRARAAEGDAVPDALTGRDVRSTAFDLVRGGYDVGAVDTALDRLESVIVTRAREEFVARHGQAAWEAELADGARSLRGRLARPDGQRFAPAHRGQAAYHRADVDALCHRLLAHLDGGAPLTAQDVRGATFAHRRGAAGYAEPPVDAFCRRAVEVLLGAES